jgi:predicted transcriptional regulator of viral defense system
LINILEFYFSKISHIGIFEKYIVFMLSSPGQLETRFFGYTQGRNVRSIETSDLVRALGITPIQERKLLSRLSRRGLIVRVRRGLYLVPPRFPAGGKWSPGEALALTSLIKDRNGQYQICGPNAFYRYGWDDQVPNRTYVYNNRISGERQIGPVTLTLIQVADERLGAIEVVTTLEGIDLVYSSRVRSLMDAVYDWSRFNTLPRAYEWIEAELIRDDRLAADLIGVTLRYGNQGTLRRIGKLLEMKGVQPSLLRKIEKALQLSSGLIPWIPTFPKRGKTDRRWGIVLNDG